VHQDSTALHVELLRREPLLPVPGCAEIVAHQASDVFELWERWESSSGERQEPPFWAAVWPGAALVCRVILDRPELVSGKRVIDVGCGSGVVSVAAIKAGANNALANDICRAAVDAAQENATRNAVEVEGVLADLTQQSVSFGPGDVLVFSELFYDASGAGALREMGRRAAQQGARVLIADGERAFLERDELTLFCEQTLDVNQSLEGAPRRVARVFEWRASSA
jgi:predicted nicotinamide N-methyase